MRCYWYGSSSKTKRAQTLIDTSCIELFLQNALFRHCLHDSSQCYDMRQRAQRFVSPQRNSSRPISIFTRNILVIIACIKNWQSEGDAYTCDVCLNKLDLILIKYRLITPKILSLYLKKSKVLY